MFVALYPTVEERADSRNSLSVSSELQMLIKDYSRYQKQATFVPTNILAKLDCEYTVACSEPISYIKMSGGNEKRALSESQMVLQYYSWNESLHNTPIGTLGEGH